MQVSSARRRLRADARLAPTFSQRAEVLAIYGAFALIAVVVFGTISYHPF
jgi:hypothetical protein